MMKRPNSWSEEQYHLQKRRRLQADSNEDNTLEPSQSTLKDPSRVQEQGTPMIHHNRLPDPKANWIFDWIPQPTDFDGDLDINLDGIGVIRDNDSMTTPSRATKRSRSGSDGSSTDVSGNTQNISYSNTGYPTRLEDHDCYMRVSEVGPDPNDIAFSQRLLQHKTHNAPRDTMFEDPQNFYDKVLSGRSESFTAASLHYLLVPMAHIQFFRRGQRHLEHVIDGVNDSWAMTDRILGPTPQPDHSRCLRKSAFSEEEQQKLRDRPAGTASYAVRDGMYFPYLTCEIKSNWSGLDIADRQNMHSMSIALRSLVQLAEAAGTPWRVHRHILGYSISHNSIFVQIYGHYPELEDGGRTKYFRYPVAEFSIWSDENKWKCYSFVEALDAEFLSKHIALVKELLAGINLPEPSRDPQTVGTGGGLYTPPSSGRRYSSYSRGSDNLLQDTTTKNLRQDLIDRLEASEKRRQEEKEDSKREAKEREDRLQEEKEDSKREAKEREDRLQRQLDAREESHRRELEEREDRLQRQLDAREESHRRELEEQRLYFQKLMEIVTDRLPKVGES